LKEAPFTRLTPLVQALAQALRPYMDIPFAFFGYSMGALISFELIRYLRRTHSPGPLYLFVAAHRAPQLPQEHPDLHQLSEPEFLDALNRLGGTPATVSQHAELMKLMLPMVRADFALCETYVYSAEAPLDCPITVFGGEQDAHVSLASLSAWREQAPLLTCPRHVGAIASRGRCCAAQRQFTLNILPGNHFFLQSQQTLILQAIAQDLAKILEDIPPLKESNL